MTMVSSQYAILGHEQVHLNSALEVTIGSLPLAGIVEKIHLYLTL